VDPIANAGGESPAGAKVAEEVVGDGAEEVDFAVAAGEEELESFSREEFDGSLREIEALEFGCALNIDDVAAAEPEVAGGREKAGAAVAERVEVFVDGNFVERLSVRTQLLSMETVVGVDAGDRGEMGCVFGMEV
jgi:hypothetical protein